MNVLIVGGGAIGGPLALRLSGALAYNVVLIEAWSEHRKAIEERGLAVETRGGTLRQRINVIGPDRVAGLREAVDLAFICIKSYDTDSTLDLITPLLAPGAIVVSTQNGMNEEKIAVRFGDDRLVGAVTEMGGYLRGPGQIVETRPDGGFVVGELAGTVSDRTRCVAEVLEHAAPTTISTNIKGLLWSKLLWNCSINPLTAMTGMGQGTLLHWSPGRRLALGAGGEVAAIAKSLNVRLEPLEHLGIDPRRLTGGGTAAQEEERSLLRRYASQMEKSTSMSQDIASRRRTEIDALNGYVVEKGRTVGVPTPINCRIVETIHALETGRLNPGPELVDSFAASADGESEGSR